MYISFLRQLSPSLGSWRDFVCYCLVPLGSSRCCWQNWKRWRHRAQRWKGRYKSHYFYLNWPLPVLTVCSYYRAMMALKAPRDQMDHQAHQARQDWWYIHVQNVNFFPPFVAYFLCFSLLSVIFSTFSTLGSTWYWRNWWKGWKTGVAGELRPSCPHTWWCYSSLQFKMHIQHMTFATNSGFVIREKRALQVHQESEESQWVSPLTSTWPNLILGISSEGYDMNKVWEVWCVYPEQQVISPEAQNLAHGMCIHSWMDVFNRVNSLFYIPRTIPCSYCLLGMYMPWLLCKFVCNFLINLLCFDKVVQWDLFHKLHMHS